MIGSNEYLKRVTLGTFISSLFISSQVEGREVNRKIPHYSTLEDVVEGVEDRIENSFCDFGRDFSKFLVIIGESQRMYVVEDGEEHFRITSQYKISTSKNGFGVEENSYKTPTGVFSIREKYGGTRPLGALFKDGTYKGRGEEVIEDKDNAGNYMSSRVFRLEGCQQRNDNTYERGITIHGTYEEDKLGRPASHGCIRMGNKQVKEVYDEISRNIPVYIFTYKNEVDRNTR